MHFCAGLPIILVGCKKDLRRDARVIDELRKTSQRPVTPEEVCLWQTWLPSLTLSTYIIPLHQIQLIFLYPYFPEFHANPILRPQSTALVHLTFMPYSLTFVWICANHTLLSYREWRLPRRLVPSITWNVPPNQAKVYAKYSSMLPGRLSWAEARGGKGATASCCKFWLQRVEPGVLWCGVQRGMGKWSA